MIKNNIGYKNIIADIASAFLLALCGAALMGFQRFGLTFNRLATLLLITAGALMVLRALLLLLDMGGLPGTIRILKKCNFLSLEVFAHEAGLTKREAQKLMSCYISRKYLRGYVDKEGEIIMMQNSDLFDAKQYAAYLKEEKIKRQSHAHAAE